MIPLIFSEQGSVPRQASPKAEPTIDGAEAAIFGDLVALPPEVVEGGGIALADTPEIPVAVAEPVEVEVTVASVDESLPETESDVAPSQSVEVKQTTAVAPEAPIAAADGKSPANPAPVAFAPDPRPRAEQDTVQPLPPDRIAPPKDNPAPVRTTVAQTVLEGRLPLSPPAWAREGSTPKADPPVIDVPKASAPQNPSVPATPAQPVMAGQDVQMRNLHALVPKDGQPQAADDPPRPSTPPVPQAAAMPAPANPQPPAVALAQAAARLQPEMAEKIRPMVEAEPVFTPVTTERAITTTTAQSIASPGAPPEMARHAAAQIAMAITNTTGKVTEIALNPEELGRVRLSLSAVDGAITLNVMAERPETQDLLRRHMDMLAQEFRELGYSSISFSFGKENGDARSDVPLGAEHPEIDIDEALPTPDHVPIRRTTGLDLRI